MNLSKGTNLPEGMTLETLQELHRLQHEVQNHSRSDHHSGEADPQSRHHLPQKPKLRQPPPPHSIYTGNQQHAALVQLEQSKLNNQVLSLLLQQQQQQADAAAATPPGCVVPGAYHSAQMQMQSGTDVANAQFILQQRLATIQQPVATQTATQNMSLASYRTQQQELACASNSMVSPIERQRLLHQHEAIHGPTIVQAGKVQHEPPSNNILDDLSASESSSERTKRQRTKEGSNCESDTGTDPTATTAASRRGGPEWQTDADLTHRREVIFCMLELLKEMRPDMIKLAER